MTGQDRVRKRKAADTTGAKRRWRSVSPKRVFLPSVDEGFRPDNSQGIADRPPLVEEVFSISFILNDPYIHVASDLTDKTEKSGHN